MWQWLWGILIFSAFLAVWRGGFDGEPAVSLSGFWRWVWLGFAPIALWRAAGAADEIYAVIAVACGLFGLVLLLNRFGGWGFFFFVLGFFFREGI